eukprot:866472-Prorocentrum_minimum.AAC.2
MAHLAATEALACWSVGISEWSLAGALTAPRYQPPRTQRRSTRRSGRPPTAAAAAAAAGRDAAGRDAAAAAAGRDAAPGLGSGGRWRQAWPNTARTWSARAPQGRGR